MSVENPLISVIIPVYNTENYLEECLDSVLNQTLKEIEVICIDDNSTDNSLSILKEYKKKDNRIKILENSENLGQAISRNKCLEEVNGNYITFMDSDDKIDLNTYEKIYKFTKENNQDLILFDVNRFDENGELKESELHTKSIIGKTIEKTNIIEHNEFIYDTSPCNKLIKTSFLKENNIKFINKLYEDLLFSMQLFTSTDSVGVYPNVKYYWRMRRNDSNKSVTQERTNIKNIKDRIFITNEIIKLFKSNEKYQTLLTPLYCKLTDIDFRLYIDQIDKGNEEYKNIIINEIKPIVETFPKEVFEELSDIRKVKYDLLINGNIENLVYIVSNERENRKILRERNRFEDKNTRLKELSKERKERIIELKEKNKELKEKNKELKEKNKELKEEIKVIKSTKGWVKYKSNNIYTRISKNNANNID